METYTIGTCEQMCPQNQIKMRTNSKLLHFYEIDPPISSLRQRQSNFICISEFCRSAAGHRNARPGDLRTPATLRRTVDYLLDRVLFDGRKSFWFAYEFVFDRLRCVRQEIVIQNLDGQTTIDLLEPIVAFLAYSSYRLCEAAVTHFDPYVCNQHLQECLKKLLSCYDDVDRLNVAAEDHTIRFHSNNRQHFEAMYLVFNLGNADAIRRGVRLSTVLRRAGTSGRCSLVQICLDMSLSFHGRAFHRVLLPMRQLPALLAAVAALKLPIIRREMFAIFSTAYHSKVLTVPLKWLNDMLLYSGDVEHLLADLKHYKCMLNDDAEGVHFRRDLFDDQIETKKPRHETFVNDLFADEADLTATLLMKQLIL